MTNSSYKEIATGYVNTDKNGEKYLTVTLKEDMLAGSRIYLRKNKFKKPGETSPDYRYSVKVEEPMTEEQVNQVNQDVFDALG